MYVVAASQQQQAISSQNIGCENVKIKKMLILESSTASIFIKCDFPIFFPLTSKKINV